MPPTSYLSDDDAEIFLPPYDEEDYAPPPSLNGGRVWQNPRTAGVISPQELNPIRGGVGTPGVMSSPPGAPQVGVDAGMEDMMQSDVPPGALPAMQRIAGGAAQSDAPDPGMPPGPDYSALEKLYRDYPKLEKPKWYQRLGGAAAGFGAGWSNAASRTEHPIDIPAMEHNILHPGYDDEVAQWQSHAGPEEKIAGLEGSRQNAWWKNKELQARADMEKQHGSYWAHRAELEQKQWAMVRDPKTGMMYQYNTITGEHREIAPPTKEKSKQEWYDEGINVLKMPPDEAAWYAATEGKMSGYGSTLANPAKATDPIVHELQQGRLDAMHDRAIDVVQKAKVADEDKVWKERSTEVAKLVQASGQNTEEDLWANPVYKEKLKAINHQYWPRLKNIQQTYEEGVARIGGTPDRYTIDPYSLEYKRVGAGPAPQTPAQAAAPATPKPSGQRITVKLPDGRFMTGTPDQFKEAGIQLNQ